ncbi:MAG: hypothetical protein C0483_06740 [Pirellula sp.]|nr:hypothetical protein [Pirellula sp.]
MGETFVNKWLQVWLFAGVAFAAAQALGAPPAEAPVRVDDPLAAINGEFRSTYARVRADAVAKTRPIILFDGEKFTLLQGEQRITSSLVPATYHRLKAAAHFQLMIFLEFQGGGAAPRPASDITRWQSWLALAEAAATADANFGLSAEQQAAQQEILRLGRSFLSEAIENRTATPEALREFCDTASPLIEQHLTWAAEIELDHYRGVLETWRKELTGVQWEQLRVVVMGSQMPRRNNRVVQLLAAMLGVAGEGDRIIYAESIYEEPRALSLLGTHIIDGAAGDAFFGDAARMSQDLLAPAAAEYVRRHFPKPSK